MSTPDLFDHTNAAPTPRTTLYWAYGSNLSKAQMKSRAPTAKPVRALPVYGCKLVFRGVADVELTDDQRDVTLGGLWRISARDERVLDRYEGVSGGTYSKQYFYLRDKHRHYHRVLFYKMNSDGVFPPGEDYLATIIEGYHDFGLDVSKLDTALSFAWNRSNKTEDVRQRYLRNRPVLAKTVAQARRPMIGSLPPPPPHGKRSPKIIVDRRSPAAFEQPRYHQPTWPSNGLPAPITSPADRKATADKAAGKLNRKLEQHRGIGGIPAFVPPRRMNLEQARLQKALAAAERRPANYHRLSPEEQQAVDRSLAFEQQAEAAPAPEADDGEVEELAFVRKPEAPKENGAFKPRKIEVHCIDHNGQVSVLNYFTAENAVVTASANQRAAWMTLREKAQAQADSWARSMTDHNIYVHIAE